MREDRNLWLKAMRAIAEPVLRHAADGTLKTAMPLRGADLRGKEECSYLEALGRTLCGVAPWLALKDPPDSEKALQKEWQELARSAITRATNPNDDAYLPFSTAPQQLVDAAFLAQGILRAPKELFDKLDDGAKRNLIAAMESTRGTKPYFCNWLLFSAEIEAFLHRVGRPFDAMRVDYAIRQHEQWYLGDGVYGDGPRFAWDYYNSYVIHPMLCDLAAEFAGGEWEPFFEKMRARSARFASHQERMIMPDGSYPVIGRSSAYRFGAFHALAQCALNGNLPCDLSPAAVRCGLTKVIERVTSAKIFDENGWLQIGITNEQPGIGEGYISTGSLYLCCAVFLPLGLPETDPFWSDPSERTSQEKIWNGEDIPCDHAQA